MSTAAVLAVAVAVGFVLGAVVRLATDARARADARRLAEWRRRYGGRR